MEKNERLMTNDCNFSSVKPAMVDLEYPPIQARGRNQEYAGLLSIDYCGAVSELTAITQYINQENLMSCERCPMAKTILGIAMAEMIHLQKLGELIFLLGGTVDFSAREPGGREKLWTPAYLNLSKNINKMICASINAERATINQYRLHINMIGDDCVNAVLNRIIKDEEYHIMILQMLLDG